MNDDDGGGLALLDAGPKGRGVFATRSFRPGEAVLAFHGPLLIPAQIVDFTHTIQVDVDRFLGPSGEFDDFVNHSCEPNCGLRSAPPRLALIALRDIAAGQEITFDYSTCIVVEPGLVTCHCGSPGCRGSITAYRELDRATRARYGRLGAVPEFVLRPIARPRRARSAARG